MVKSVWDLPIDIVNIQSLIPHRYPFLLVDRVLELEPEKRIKAIKNVTVNEPFFNGHFPGKPVMPGVLIIESMAQAGGLLSLITRAMQGIDNSDKLFYLVKIENVRFSKMVVPGDQLELNVSLKRRIRNMALYEGSACVDGKEVACAEILVAEADK
jgi:3-hydroxyacyl-[acyl-carrier-protein] dehydratase